MNRFLFVAGFALLLASSYTRLCAAPPAVTTGTLTVWLDATDVNGNATTPANGAAVTTWVNKAGGVGNFTVSAGGTDNPSFTAISSAFNNQPVVHFTAGMGKWLLNSANLGNTVTVLYVGRKSGSDSGHLVSASGNNWLLGYWNTKMNCSYWVNTGNYQGTATADNVAHVWAGVANGSTFTCYRADLGVAEAQFDSGALGAGPSSLTLGSWNGAEVGGGDIGELLVYSGALSQADRTNVEAYLLGKWFSNAPVMVGLVPALAAYVGEYATLRASPSGAAPLFCQWRKNGIVIAGATGADYSITHSLSTNDAGSYSLIVTNVHGSVTGTVAVTVTPVTGITNALIAYWKFDQTNGALALDVTTNANHGAMINFPSDSSKWVSGKIGNALSFRGSGYSDYIFVTNYPKPCSSMTISAWVWADARPTWATIIKNWPSANGQFHFGLQDTAGDLSNFLYEQGGVAIGPVRENSVFPLGSWQHVATVCDGQTMRLYRNGLLVGTLPYNGTIQTNAVNQSLSIGAKWLSGTSADSFWQGKMDDLGLWSRGLTASEIAAIYGAGLEGRSLDTADVATGGGGAVVISEFMASNTGFLRDEDGDSPDWIEIYNGSTAPVDLAGWFLTDKSDNLTKWRFPSTNLPPSSYLVVFASGKNRAVAGAELHTSFDLKASGEYLALVDTHTNIISEFSPTFAPQVANVSYGLARIPVPTSFVATGSIARVLVPANDALGTSWILSSFDDSAWLAGTNGVGYDTAPADPVNFTNLIRTDLAALMRGSNTSVFARFPFVVSNPADFMNWRLRMQYDDGFKVWLNGVEVVDRNAPENPVWNSTATAARNATNAFEAEEFNLAEFEPLIAPGTNILAVQGLNAALDSTRFIILPQLLAQSVTNYASALRYFTLPTPGGPNIGGVTTLGPIITDLTHTPSVPLDSDNLLVSARVTMAFGPVTNVTLHYRVMFSNEATATMFDDGAHGDGAAADGVFGAAIPASASGPGQMVRYYVTALDNAGRSSRWPLFLDATASAQYQGTMVQDLSITSALPVLHWFVADTNAAETDTGTQCSLFYNGELYDNLHVRIRGDTARSWPKKCYKFDFNEGEHFQIAPGLSRVSEINVNTTYTDKSFVRAMLAWESYRNASSPGCLSWDMRLQQNGAFFSVAIFVEQADKDYLSRQGLDPNGALYKRASGSADPGLVATSAYYEKKTRKTEDKSDLQAFINGISTANSADARKRFLFDNVNLPQVVSYMAASVLVQNIDRTVKNYFWYRDSDGTREWQMFAWDVDLSFGPNALNTDLMEATDDTAPDRTCHPFFGAYDHQFNGLWNYLLDAIITTPETRQMFLRRLRTITEAQLASGWFAQRIDQLVPTLNADVLLDHARWGANAHFAGTSYTLQQATDRIKNEYLTPRRTHLLTNHVVGSGYADNAGIPLAQPWNAGVSILAVEFNPANGNQAQEYVCLTNANPFPIEMTSWRISEAIDHTFLPGTVMPSNSVMYLSPNVVEFRARLSGPRGGQGLFVQGNYQGQLSARGGAITLLTDYGRPVSSLTYTGAPSLAQQFLRITEIMYHPSPLAGNTNAADEFEFIELKNISTTQTLDLNNVRFIDGITFNFSGSIVTSLSPGQTVLIVKNLAAFTTRYGSGFTIAGEYADSLENKGERLRLVDALGEEILDFSYDNNWHPITDGLGFSLVIADATALWNTWGDKTSWRASSAFGGSPGGSDPALPTLAPILINEVLSHTDLPAVDAIELFNPTTNVVNIGGWFLTDDFNTPNKFRIPTNTVISAGGFVVFTEADFNPGGLGFAFGSDGDEAYLFSADAAGNLTSWFHGFSFGASPTGVTLGRYETSQGEEHFVVQAANTLWATNAGPRVGPVVISEIMFHPPDLGTNDNQLAEFIELQNITATNVALFDPAYPLHTWRLRNAVDFDFPTNVSLSAGARLLVVGFDPVVDTASLATFRATYGLGTNIVIIGPWSGKLDNSANTIELKLPDTPNGTNVPYVLVEQIAYRDTAPWPGADGDGTSLQRLASSAYGNDPIHWAAAAPTPGTAYVGGTPPTITTQPASQTVLANQTATFIVTATGSTPLSYQWRHNGTNIASATNSALVLTNVQFTHYGNYSAVVFNTAGSAESATALLAIGNPPTITVQPQGGTVAVGSNVTLSVTATGTGTIRYQWRFNSADLPGKTNAALTISNIQFPNSGTYTVVVTDDVGPVTSAPAVLTVIAPPVILLQPVPPLPQTVLQGTTLTMSVVVTGTPPLSYKWRRNNITIANQTNATLLMTNIQPSPYTNYTVIITNLFGAATTAPPVVITILADNDRDGLADDWERKFGFATNNAADALLDSDGDGMLNWQEYVAGTNPTNAASYLKLEAASTCGSACITFEAVSNRTYAVYYSTGLSPSTWTNLADVPARPTNWNVTIPDPVATTNRFYRVIIPAYGSP